MGERFPAVTAKETIRVIKKLGFVFARQSGTSHAIYYRNSDRRRTVVPIHAKTILKRKTLKAILNDAGIAIEEFRNLL